MTPLQYTPINSSLSPTQRHYLHSINDKEMKTTYFKTVIQKTSATHSILVAVIPNDMLGNNMPEICEIQAFMMPQTIYTGTYPQIKVNTDTIKDRSDLKGMGIAGIVTEDLWYCKEVKEIDNLGIAL